MCGTLLECKNDCSCRLSLFAFGCEAELGIGYLKKLVEKIQETTQKRNFFFFEFVSVPVSSGFFELNKESVKSFSVKNLQTSEIHY